MNPNGQPTSQYMAAPGVGGAVPTQPGVYGPQQQPVAAAPTNPNSTQNSLQIAEIRDGIVIMNDGSFRAVVMCKAINFDLMSPQEREAVEYSYQGFLNSLYFPVQIFIRSQKVDLRPYIEKLDKIRSEHENMLLALLMEDYLAFMSDLATQTNVMDKKFYVAIPLFPTVEVGKVVGKATNASKGFLANAFGQKEQKVTINEADLERAKTELRNRVQSVMSGLQQAGIQSLPLDTQELIELYYDAYNPDTATRQQLKNFNDLSTPVVTKGVGTAPQPQLDRETV
jgi:type IV secretory pathway VirB4 component